MRINTVSHLLTHLYVADDVVAIVKIFGKEIARDAVKYMSADRMQVDFKLKSARFKVRDTVNHGSVIGKLLFLNSKVSFTIN